MATRWENEAKELESIRERIIAGLVEAGLGIVDGNIRTFRTEPQYRRLDVGPRALCYIRCRPRHRAVRIDISGLWPATKAKWSPLQRERGSSGFFVMVKTRPEAEVAIKVLASIVREELEDANAKGAA